MLKIGVGYQALIAVILGILVGLFFGPLCAPLEPVGVTYVMLLQMVVLPYIPTLLIHGLGSLSPDTAKKLFTRGWFFLVLLWAIVFGVIYALWALIPTPLPDPSVDFSEEKTQMATNILAYIIPQNPFYDLSHNIVPAVAFFSLIVGVAVMHLKQKEPLLGVLERANNALEKIIKWLAIIAPIGIFAHIAYVMGTVNLQDLVKLELYVVAFILVSIFLSIWVLPMIVSCLTGISYRELMLEYHIVCILPFATGIPSIAFPFINNCMRRLAEKKNLDLATFRSTSQTVVPLAYSFAQVGNFFLMFFVFFMAYYYRHQLSARDLFIIPLLTIPISFGTPQLSLVGMSFLIDALSFPREAFFLFAEMGSITLNFQVLLSVAGMLTFIILVLLRYYRLLEINWLRLSTQCSTMLVVLLAGIVIGKQFVEIEDNYRDLYYKLTMNEAITDPPEVTLYKERIPRPPDNNPESLSRALKSKVLRVGYETTNIPFCYLNEVGDVVGYDIAFAYQLAKDLDVKLELVPLDINNLGKDLDSGYYDIAMSAICIDQHRILDMDFCQEYSEQPNSLVVPVNKVDAFRNLADTANDPNIKILADGAYVLVVEHHLPKAQMINVDSFDPILNGEADAMMWSELPSYIWCLGHPEFTTLSYHKQLGIRYFAYPVKTGSFDTINFIDHWLVLKRLSGFTDAQKDYWISGKRPNEKAQRWSIIRNVLHWVD